MGPTKCHFWLKTGKSYYCILARAVGGMVTFALASAVNVPLHSLFCTILSIHNIVHTGGYFYLDEVLSLTAFTQQNVTEGEMLQLIEGNDKQRFAVDERNGRKVVKANQGHSVEVK